MHQKIHCPAESEKLSVRAVITRIANSVLCSGGNNDGKPCEIDKDCGGRECTASIEATSPGVDKANQGTDLAFSGDGTTAYAVDQFFNSLHIFNTAGAQDGNATTTPKQGQGSRQR